MIQAQVTFHHDEVYVGSFRIEWEDRTLESLLPFDPYVNIAQRQAIRKIVNERWRVGEWLVKQNGRGRLTARVDILEIHNDIRICDFLYFVGWIPDWSSSVVD